MVDKALFTSESGEWETPDALFQTLHQRYRFTVDAAASPENAKLPRFWTNDKDGLKQSWAEESVWCNPPYGRRVGLWVKKAHDERFSARCSVLLLPARTDTAWFHDYVLPGAWELFFLRGRVHFSNTKVGAPFPSILVVFDEIARLYTKHTSSPRVGTWLHREKKAA